MTTKSKEASVRIEESLFIVNNTIIPYAKQIIRSQETLFITDLGIEVPITHQLRAYDESYFHSLLKKQIVTELESNHASVGLEILQQLPDLQAEHYEYLLSKISFRKLTKLMMDDDFLVFLCQKLRRLVNLPVHAQEEAVRSIIINLSEPYQRAIYLLTSIQESCGGLKEKLEITCKLLIYQIISQPNFIEKLAYPSHFSSDDGECEKIVPHFVDSRFLQKLQEYGVCLRFLQKNTSLQWQIDQYYLNRLEQKSKAFWETNILLQSRAHLCNIKNNLFNRPCLNFIAKYFKHFFHYNRKDLLQILVLIITHNREQFWKELISFASNSEQQPEERTEGQVSLSFTDNSNSLREFMLNNYFSNDGYSWSQSLCILEGLNQIREAESMLIDLYHDFVQFPLRVDVIDLISAFIRATVTHNCQLSPHFKQLLSAFVYAVSSQVDQMQAFYNKLSKRIQTQNKFLLIRMRILMLPKVNTILLCAFIRVFSLLISSNLLDYLQSFNYQQCIQKLIKMSLGKDSAIYGAKTQLIRLIQLKIGGSNNQELSTQEFEAKKNNSQAKRQSSIQRLNRILI